MENGAFDTATLIAYVEPENASTFGGAGAQWNNLTIVIRTEPIPISILGTQLRGSNFTIHFGGEPGISDWRMLGSEQKKTFADDLTTNTGFSETTPGEYEAVIDISENPLIRFFRVAR